MPTIKSWMYANFGDIFNEKKIILSRLDDIYNSTNWPASDFLKNLESNLRNDYNNILKIKKDYWKFRIRISWLKMATLILIVFICQSFIKDVVTILFSLRIDGTWITILYEIQQHTT